VIARYAKTQKMGIFQKKCGVVANDGLLVDGKWFCAPQIFA